MDQPSTTPAAPSRRPTSRRNRRLLAGALAALGVSAIVLALSADPESPDPAPARTAGSLAGEPAGGEPVTTATPQTGIPAADAKEPTDGPGGVGSDPKKTGLPAQEAEGLVRTGGADEGCFADMGSYLEEWHRTGVEPDPCFQSQPASGQKQPEGVKRSYNGEKF